MEDRAITVFIDDLKPATLPGIKEEVVVRVIAEDIARAKAIAYQRPWIIFLTQGNAVVEFGKILIFVIKVGGIESGYIVVGRGRSKTIGESRPNLY